jgi:hypothetical protein
MSDIVEELKKWSAELKKNGSAHEAVAEIERHRGLIEYLALSTDTEIAASITTLAWDTRLDSMPAKFRYFMLEAARRLLECK